MLSAFGFSACSDYLDKENSTELDLELVFNDKERVEGWLGYIYSGIPDPYLGYLQRTGWDILSDDITPSERYRQFSGWGVIPFILGEWTTNSNWMPVSGRPSPNAFAKPTSSCSVCTPFQNRASRQPRWTI